jgi:hypothetical protein
MLAALAACAPPPEIDRPVTPPDARAAELLPPGRAADPGAMLKGYADGAAVERAGGERMAAFRFASPGAAAARFAELERAIAARKNVGSRSSMALGDARYVRHAGAAGNGLAWTSGVWVFAAEAPDAARLAALIGAARAGGLGADAAAGLGAAFLGSLLGTVLLTAAVAWAAIALALRCVTVKPAPGAAPVARSELVARLMALNGPAAPYVVRQEPSGEVVAEWKYADAQWWGVLAKSGVRKAYRLRLGLDERRRDARALDEFGSVEWSAGALTAPTVSYRRTFFRGVVLARYERGVAYGFRTPTGGGAGKAMDYKFDMMALKGPVIETVTAAGWRFRPVLWRRGLNA